MGRVLATLQRDNLSLVAAGVAFYLLLAVFPGLLAFLLLAGLFLDVPDHPLPPMGVLWEPLPAATREMLLEQWARLEQIARRDLQIGFVIAFSGALIGASSGLSGLLTGICIAEQRPARRFLHQRLVALALTFGALLFLLLTLVGLVGLPLAIRWLPQRTEVLSWLQWARWPGLAFLMWLSFTTLYRFASEARAPTSTPVKRTYRQGAALATVACLLLSAAFTVYVEQVARLQQTYGTLSGVVAFLLWLFAHSFFILLGAAWNASAYDTEPVGGVPRPVPGPAAPR